MHDYDRQTYQSYKIHGHFLLDMFLGIHLHNVSLKKDLGEKDVKSSFLGNVSLSCYKNYSNITNVYLP